MLSYTLPGSGVKEVWEKKSLTIAEMDRYHWSREGCFSEGCSFYQQICVTYSKANIRLLCINNVITTSS